MMPLRLQVVMSALDKASRPFRGLTASSSRLATTLRSQKDALRKLQATHSDVGAYRQQAAAVRDTGQELIRAQDRVRRLAAQMAAVAGPSKGLERQFRAAINAARDLKTSHEKNRLQLHQLRGELDRAGVSTRQLSTHERALRTRVAETSQAIAQQQAALTRLAASRERVARQEARLQRVAGFGREMASSGALAVGTTYGFVRSLARAVTVGARFEAQMSRVQALTRLDKGSVELDALREQARLLGATTSFKASEAAEGQGFLAMAGFTPEAIRLAMPAMLDMAKAGGLELARTADISSNILSGFGLKADEMHRVADVLTLGFSTANTNLEMLGDTMKYVAPIAKASGVSLEESVAMAGLLGNVGIQSSQAGTTLRSMLLRLASPSASAAAALAKLNVQTQDSSGNLRSMIDVTSDVAKAVEHLGNGERLSFLKTIFGEEPAAGMAELIERAGAGEIEKYRALLQASEGTAAQVAAIMADNEQGRWQELVSSVEDLMITLSKLLEGPLKWLIRTATTFSRRLNSWIAENETLARSVIVVSLAAGGLIAVGGAVMLLFGTLAGPISLAGRLMLSAAGHMDRLGSVLKGATPFLRALPAVLGPATLPLLALAAAAVLVAVLIWKYWGPLKAFILGVWDGIVEAVQPAMDELMTALEPLAPVWDMVSSAMGKAWAWFKKLLTPFEATSEQLQGATDAGKGFGSVLGGVLAGGVRRTAAVITTLIEAFKIVLPILKNVFGGAWQYLQGAWSMIVGLFTGDGERIRSGLSLMWQGINNILMGWPEKMMQAGRDMLAGLRDGIIANAFVVREAIAGVANGAMDRFKGLLGINSPSRVFAQYGDFTMQGLAGGLQRSQSAPLQQVSGLGERMRQLGSGLALSAAIPAAAAAPIMTPGTVAAGTAGTAPVSYTINIHAPAGSDAQDIARMVRDAVAQIERDRNSRRASRLTD